MDTTTAGAGTGRKFARVVTRDGLELKFMSDSVQVVNVLEPEHYALGAIKGSWMIPLSELDQRYSELDRAKEIVTYCADASSGASRQAAELLMSKGFNAGTYEGGIAAWKAAGLPTVKGHGSKKKP